MRARGLKPGDYFKIGASHVVALRAGAWIETPPIVPATWPAMVALRAGAWIETDQTDPTIWDALGRAPCGRVD